MRVGILVAVLLGTLTVCLAQEWRVAVHAPSARSLHSWAQDAPTIRLQAALQRAGVTVISGQGETAQLFLTAQVYENGALVDRVTMWDDGTHGDAQAGDGTYTALYRPPRPANYRVRIRAQVERQREGKPTKREFWSDFVPFEAVVIPYARLTQPEPGSAIPARTTARARLLLGESPYLGQNPTLTALLRIEGEGWQQEVPMRRSESLLTASVELPKRGAYRLTTIVRVQRNGHTLQSQSEVVQVEAVTLSYFWLYVAIGLALVYLLLPPRQPPLRYRHTLRLANQTHRLEPGQTLTVGGLELRASDAEPKVVARVAAGSTIALRKAGEPLRQTELALKEGEQCLADAETLRYERAEPLRANAPLWSRLMPTTLPRRITLLCALGALGYWWRLWLKFIQ
jgi:hypothetical protein